MFIKPATGWENFNQCDELLELIATSLRLEENEGIWQYYNFSECCSVWCSCEVSATNQVQITFDNCDANARIKSLVLEMTNNSGRHFKQLFRLRKELKNQFDIHDD
ncbi:hypothetical protein [Aliikangiella coralliicola]|uniref:Uncharacterized protein n=1 Tax=Aliikangiella coralliicola TaxID=2592383 RepID=A0A545UJR4_9GAMM|nr:hypothetical protein [Aliikangiella coralliicola]TQV89699.1 hypothetical protein FLL46_02115 [Aliikangiella coralliicola]